MLYATFSTLLFCVLASATNSSVNFQRTLHYSKLNLTEQYQLESFLNIAADNLNANDGETFVHITNALAPNLGTIFTLFKKLNTTKEFRRFVELTASEKEFDSKLDTALANSNFSDVEVLQHAGVELQAVLTPKLKHHYAEFSSLQVTKDLFGSVTHELSDLNEHDRVLAVGAIRIILKKNVLPYVPPTKPITKLPNIKSSASLIHKCSWLLASIIASQLLLRVPC